MFCFAVRAFRDAARRIECRVAMAAPGPARPRQVLITNDDGPTSELFVAWMKHLTEVMR